MTFFYSKDKIKYSFVIIEPKIRNKIFSNQFTFSTEFIIIVLVHTSSHTKVTQFYDSLVVHQTISRSNVSVKKKSLISKAFDYHNDIKIIFLTKRTCERI